MTRNRWILSALLSATAFAAGCGDSNTTTDAGTTPDVPVTDTPAPVDRPDAGSPAPDVVDAGSPTPDVVDAGSPTPDVVDAGSPTPDVVDAGSATPDVVDAGGGGDAGASVACVAYCTAVMTNCTGANAQYADTNECLGYCARAGWAAGAVGAMAGNNLACRTYHGGAPAAADPGTHCPHAGPTGGGVCGAVVNFRNDAPAMYRRVDRMGMPAVSTALIGDSTRKNAFNDGDPANDANFAMDFINRLNVFHMALDDDLTRAGLAPCSMTTMISSLPACLGQNYAPGRTVASLVVPNDVIQLDPATTSGFPNGRRLEDPVIDVTLAVLLLNVSNGVCGSGMCNATTFLGFRPMNGSLNPRANDVPFLTTFPYFAPPHR